MKPYSKIIAIAITATCSLYGCHEEEIKQEDPLVKDSIALVSSLNISLTNEGAYAAEYQIERNADHSVKSITYRHAYDDGTYGEPVITNFSWAADHKILYLDKTQTGVGREFYLNNDSLLVKVVTVDGEGGRWSRIFNLDGNKVTNFTDEVLDADDFVHVVTYENGKMNGIDYYSSSPSNDSYDSYVCTTSNNSNPILRLKCPELVALMYEVDLHESYFISQYEITSSHWGTYQNYDISYELNDRGNLTKINRGDNADIRGDSDIQINYKTVAK